MYALLFTIHEAERRRPRRRGLRGETPVERPVFVCHNIIFIKRGCMHNIFVYRYGAVVLVFRNEMDGVRRWRFR